jgi:hypothetical protein
MAEDTSRARLRALLLSIAAVAVAVSSGTIYQSMHIDPPIVAGSGWVKTMLSDTLPSLKGGPGDTAVYTYDSGKPGGTFVLISGMHPQEIASLVATTLVIENVRVSAGKLIVVPQANHSGFTFTDPMEAFVHDISITLPDGSSRWFPIGSRRANPADQWPDPDEYINVPSGEPMIGEEARNLNRNHPGLQFGTLTAEVSYALTTLVKGANIVLDMHEAYPEYPVINKIVYHQRAEAIAGTALFALEFDGVHFTADPSPKNLHGLSHREFGDFTPAQALLSETANPAIGRFRGRLSMDLVVAGKEPNYVAAASVGPKGLLFVPFEDLSANATVCPAGATLQQSGAEKGLPCAGWPLQVRVGRDLAEIKEIIGAYNMLNAKTPVTLTGLPDYNEIMKADLTHGVGKYLQPAPAGAPGAPPFA